MNYYLLVPTIKKSYGSSYGSLCGKKYIDTDHDCVWDPTEQLLAGWQITLKSSGGVIIATVTTDANGAYCFENLPAGEYEIGEVLPSGWEQTCPIPIPPGTYTVNLLPGEHRTGYDFANQQSIQDCDTWVSTFDEDIEAMGFKIPTDAKLMTRNLAVGDNGDVYVCGYSNGNGTNTDYVTIMYDKTGVEQWTAAYDNVINGKDMAYALVIDDDGNVYVTGESKSATTNMDIATVKYDNAGVKQWEARWNNTAKNSRDAGYAIALNNDGSIVYITGETKNVSPKGVDYITMAYFTASMAIGADVQWIWQQNRHRICHHS
jgi:hypothetical protein